MLRALSSQGRIPMVKRQLVRTFINSRAVSSSLPPKGTIIPKFEFPKNTHTIQSINNDIESHWGKEVIISGWIDKKPKKISKNIAFGTLRDYDGNFTQLVTTDPELVDLLKSSQVEDCVAIKGLIEQRPAKDADSTEVRWDLKILEYNTLNSCDVLGSQLESLKTTPDAFPPEYRYLQLRLPFFQQALKKRAQAATIIRNELNKLSFTEIETPLLFKSTPEGAREFLVPTRRESLFYALPQSPQQYKQLLMASGVKNYFQVAKCFRDEDLRADRQPEFTQIDLEMSFAGARDVQNVIESTVKKVWKEVAGEEIMTIDGTCDVKSGDLVHMTYHEALSKYGIDKPDLRSTIEILDISDYAEAKENPGFEVVEACVLKGAFTELNTKLPKALFDKDQYKGRVPNIVPIKGTAYSSSILGPLSQIAEVKQENVEGLKSRLALEPGDIVAFSTRAKLSYENPTPLGRFRQLAIQGFPDNWRRDAKFVGAWIEDFPLFTPSEKQRIGKHRYPLYDYSKLESTHHPFTMVQPSDYEFLETDPLKAKGEHYDLVINGVELGGGSRRVHDSELQRYIFTEILKIENPDRLFGHLLKALSLGCPPHAGFAIGFDRMCAMMIGSNSIRDVVAFPKTQNGTDMVVESPSDVSDETLKEYCIKKLLAKEATN